MRTMHKEKELDVRIDSRRLDIAMAIAGISTDKELARRADLSLRTIAKVREAEDISFKSWNSLARALGCNPIDLLVTPGYPDPKLAALVALSV